MSENEFEFVNLGPYDRVYLKVAPGYYLYAGSQDSRRQEMYALDAVGCQESELGEEVNVGLANMHRAVADFLGLRSIEAIREADREDELLRAESRLEKAKETLKGAESDLKRLKKEVKK